MGLITVVDKDIDVARLATEVFSLITEHNLSEYQQISLTGLDGSNDWDANSGKIRDLLYPEEHYNVVNNALVGTYIAELIQRYSRFYRWRLLKLAPKQSYSVHRDGIERYNFRLHIPVVTNDEALFSFYSTRPANKVRANVYFEQLALGNSYEVNTSGFHTAVNYGANDRYHMVGVRYEDRNNGPH